MTVPDFSGYATKAGLECTDGRTIMPEAFQHMNGKKVPLVWQHGHNDPGNVLGHAILEARPDGVYAKGFFNDTPQGQNARLLVEHDDIKSLSIYANRLVEKSKQVFHGMIREVSLVLAGANPGALIDNVTIRHSDGEEETIDEAVIYMPAEATAFQHADGADDVDDDEDDDLEHATIREVYESFSEEEKNVVDYLVGQALAANSSAEHSDDDNNPEGDLEHDQEGSSDMGRNVFDQNGAKTGTGEVKHELTHDAMKGIVAAAVKGGSLKTAVEDYALEHGITNLEILFPEAKTLTNTPEWNKRRTEWVAGVLGGARKSPFSRVKSVIADITMESARALGYVKGNFKKEEWFSLTKRTTGPTTVYKKQQLDRDDVIDIADFDVVAWMKGEMRLMLEEEIARAILIGDGRAVEDPDKIKDPVGAADGLGIRSILHDHELYTTTLFVNIDNANSSMMEVVDEVISARQYYRGTGTPTLYTTEQYLTKMLLTRDAMNRRLWKNSAELADELRVSNIVTVEVMDTVPDLVGIIVNMDDYNIGADRGGEVSLFDDFDIDYNQLKYLIETRISGALIRIKSAMVIRKTAGGNTLVTPTAPTFNKTTGVITIPTQTGTVYRADSATGTILTAGPQAALPAGASKTIVATPAASYYFANTEVDDWNFTRDPA